MPATTASAVFNVLAAGSMSYFIVSNIGCKSHISSSPASCGSSRSAASFPAPSKFQAALISSVLVRSSVQRPAPCPFCPWSVGRGAAFALAARSCSNLSFRRASSAASLAWVVCFAAAGALAWPLLPPLAGLVLLSFGLTLPPFPLSLGAVFLSFSAWIFSSNAQSTTFCMGGAIRKCLPQLKHSHLSPNVGFLPSAAVQPFQ